MKLLFVLPNDSLGGAEQYLKMIATYFKKEDITIYFLKNNKSKQWSNLDSQTKQFFMSSRHEFLGLLRFILLMLFSSKKYDYIYTSHVKTNALIGLLRFFSIVKSKFHIARESTSIFLRYKGFKLKYYKLLYAIGYNNIDVIICQTELMKNQFLKHNSKISNKTSIVVIPNPIDLSIAKTKIQEASNSFDFDYIVSAGRLIPEKGYDILIQAFKQIKEQHQNLKLVILGNGKELENLKSITEKLELINDVVFPGHVTNVYTYFKNAKLCIVSSRIEGFPNVLLQMMSQNTKVVSTLCAGGIDTIPGIFTCETNNHKLLNDAIAKCLTSNTEENSEVFKKYLNSRSIESFIKTTNKKLETI